MVRKLPQSIWFYQSLEQTYSLHTFDHSHSRNLTEIIQTGIASLYSSNKKWMYTNKKLSEEH